MMNNPRPLTEVLRAILFQFPQEDRKGGSKDVVDALFKIISIYAYTAPELQREGWELASHWLNYHVQVRPEIIDTFWQKTIHGIFNATLDYRDYLDDKSL